MLVYTPFGRKAFFNALGPCAHADPYLDRIAPGETRWLSTWLLLAEGDPGPLVERLVEFDRSAAGRSGVLSPADR